MVWCGGEVQNAIKSGSHAQVCRSLLANTCVRCWRTSPHILREFSIISRRSTETASMVRQFADGVLVQVGTTDCCWVLLVFTCMTRYSSSQLCHSRYDPRQLAHYSLLDVYTLVHLSCSCQINQTDASPRCCCCCCCHTNSHNLHNQVRGDRTDSSLPGVEKGGWLAGWLFFFVAFFLCVGFYRRRAFTRNKCHPSIGR